MSNMVIFRYLYAKKISEHEFRKCVFSEFFYFKNGFFQTKPKFQIDISKTIHGLKLGGVNEIQFPYKRRTPFLKNRN